MEKIKAAEKQPTISKELVVASLISETTRHNLNFLLEQGKKIAISRETIQADYELLMQLRDIYLLLADRRKAEDKPDRDRIAARKEGYESIMKPIEELLERVEPLLTETNNEILAGEREITARIMKENEIKTKHIEFVKSTIQSVLNASDNKELARIQMLIGTEKSKRGVYGDYYPIIEKVCDVLLALIDERKKFLKEAAKLEKEQKKWEDAGDLVRATQIREQIEFSRKVIEENANAIAEDAYNQVADVSLMNADFVSASIRPRLHRWSYRIENAEDLYKARPEFILLEANAKTIGAFIKEKAEELNEDEDNRLVNGLIIYRKQFFVSVKQQKEKDAS